MGLAGEVQIVVLINKHFITFKIPNFPLRLKDYSHNCLTSESMMITPMFGESCKAESCNESLWLNGHDDKI